jgi:hypothetical protein
MVTKYFNIGTCADELKVKIYVCDTSESSSVVHQTFLYQEPWFFSIEFERKYTGANCVLFRRNYFCVWLYNNHFQNVRIKGEETCY